MHIGPVLSIAVFTLSPFACKSADSGTLTGGPPHGGFEASSPGDSAADSYSPPDGQLIIPDDGALAVGSPCNPEASACPGPLQCCAVGGNVREGGIYFACMNPTGSPPACP